MNRYLFEELVTGGDLQSYIEHCGGRLDGPSAGLVTRQVLEGLKYLHSKDIAHRDVKPENVLLTLLDCTARVVLTDFGNAIRCLPAPSGKVSRLYTQVGTREEVRSKNVAIAQGGYTKAVDMWSVGCMAASILTGSFIFSQPSLISIARALTQEESQVIDSMAAGNLSRMDTGSEWVDIYRTQKDFIRRLLVLDETKRMTADEALNHAWFQNIWCKNLYDQGYEKAVKDWKPQPPVDNIIITLDRYKRKITGIKKTNKRKRRFEQFTPIESHYLPPHSSFERRLLPPQGARRFPTTSSSGLLMKYQGPRQPVSPPDINAPQMPHNRRMNIEQQHALYNEMSSPQIICEPMQDGQAADPFFMRSIIQASEAHDLLQIGDAEQASIAASDIQLKYPKSKEYKYTHDGPLISKTATARPLFRPSTPKLREIQVNNKESQMMPTNLGSQQTISAQASPQIAAIDKSERGLDYSAISSSAALVRRASEHCTIT
ncbi:hypothetical protein MMC25_000628 [Agyrium rufum]|nr:hypothetical protein [Agyrium rufum]